MWEILNCMQYVNTGDRVRFVNDNSFISAESFFKVTKADKHFFEVVPESLDESNYHDSRKVVKYFDIGYYINLEIWKQG